MVAPVELALDIVLSAAGVAGGVGGIIGIKESAQRTIKRIRARRSKPEGTTGK